MNALSLWRGLDALGDLWDPDSVCVFAPRVDVVEKKDSYVLTAELPGLNAQDLQIQVNDGVLELKASKTSEKKEDAKDEVEKYLIRERQSMSFERSFHLPKDVNSEAIEAQFNDGLLTLTLPKREETKPKTITIKAA